MGDWAAEALADPRSNAELIALALADEVRDEEDDLREGLSLLHYRGSWDIFLRAQALCWSHDPMERRLGVHVLAQLGVNPMMFHDDVIAIFLGMLEREQHERVLASVAASCGHRTDVRTIEPLLRYRRHPDDGVRHAVVLGLMNHERDDAIRGLIALSEDDDVRDWATFGLGSMISVDNPEIRAALLRRVTDGHPDTRSEAILGLARRHDHRVRQVVMDELSDGWIGANLFEAAEELGDPWLLPALLDVRERRGDDESWPMSVLNDAIARCWWA